MQDQSKPAGRARALALFLTFLKIGAFTFGGGYAMIPLIQREVVEKNKWITNDDVLEIVAIAESTPARSPSTPPPSSATAPAASSVRCARRSASSCRRSS